MYITCHSCNPVRAASHGACAPACRRCWRGRLATVLNQAKSLLDQHKYAFEWKSHVQNSEASSGEGSQPVSFWETVHKPSPLSAFCGTTLGMGGLTLAELALQASDWRLGVFGTGNMLMFSTSFGALSALLFGAPAAPLGAPMVTIKGFTLVMGLAVILHWTSELCLALTGFGLPYQAKQVLAPAIGIAAMLARKQPIHPPAVACAVGYMQLTDPTQQWPTYLIAPAALGVGWMLSMQLCTAKAVRYFAHIKEIKAESTAADAPQAASGEKEGIRASEGGSDSHQNSRSKASRRCVTYRASERKSESDVRLSDSSPRADDGSGSDESMSSSSRVSSRVSSRAASPTTLHSAEPVRRGNLWGKLSSRQILDMV